MGRQEEYGRWHSSQALSAAVLFDEVVAFEGPCFLWLGVSFGNLIDISSSIVSEIRELGCWWTVSLVILQQNFSPSFARLWDFLTLRVCKEFRFYHHTVG